MVVSVVTILISGFYRWTVILGLAFTMLFIGVIVFIILMTIMNMKISYDFDIYIDDEVFL